MKVLLAGCGKMGSAMLSRWLEQKLASHVTVIDPSLAVAPKGATLFASLQDIPADYAPDAVIFAVKPQTLPDIIDGYRRFAGHALFISIAAGKPVSFFTQHLGDNADIVRAMPNTPAAIGKGMTVAYAAPTVKNRSIAETLLGATGDFLWVGDEKLMNPVTALSGSGPAYIFLLIETLEKAGIEIGLPADIAGRLARQTVIGSAYLAEAEAETPAATLRQNVTSPGGTTAAALEVLMTQPDGIQTLFNRALAIATKRAEELSR